MLFLDTKANSSIGFSVPAGTSYFWPNIIGSFTVILQTRLTARVSRVEHNSGVVRYRINNDGCVSDCPSSRVAGQKREREDEREDTVETTEQKRHCGDGPQIELRLLLQSKVRRRSSDIGNR